MAHTGRQRAKERVIVELAGGATVQTAAKAAVVGERTIYTWLKDPAFKASIAEARCTMMNDALGVVSGGLTLAANTLRLLAGDSYPPTVRLGAAKALLEAGGLKLADVFGFDERLRAIEESLKMQGGIR